MEEKLNIYNENIYPKNIIQLLMWMFFSPIRAKTFSKKISKKEMIIYILKSNVLLSFFISLLFLLFSFMNFVNFNYLYALEVFILVSFFSIIISLYYDLYYKLYDGSNYNYGTNYIFNIVLAFIVLSNIELMLFMSFDFPFIISFIFGFSFGYLFLINNEYTNLRAGLLFYIIILVILTIIFFDDILVLIFKGFLYGSVISFVFSAVLTTLFLNIKATFFKLSLDDNPILDIDVMLLLNKSLIYKLSAETFKKPYLSYSLIMYMLNSTNSREMSDFAFSLANIRNASFLYFNKLSSKDIIIPNGYKKSQPQSEFLDFLKITKVLLDMYTIQNNLQYKITTLSNIILLLKECEKWLILNRKNNLSLFNKIFQSEEILLQNIWKEYYMIAIKVNLSEAIAQYKNLKIEAKNREPITPNIYNIGDPLSPNYQNQLFKGRKDVVERLSNIIYTSSQMPLLLIQGQRRVGKTSLINYLEQLLGSGFKIIKLDMQSATNKRFNSLVENINEELNKVLNIDEIIETSEDMSQSWIAFEEYLTKHTKALNYKIIIAFDEYESFHKHIVKQHGEDILENMRSFMQSQNQVIFLFSGMLRISDLTFPNWDEYFPHTQRLKVDYLSKDESLELIINPVEDFNLVYTNEVANEVYELTMGHPQLLQTICSIIVTIANQTNKKEVSREVVAKAKEEVFEINEMPMTIFWREFCGENERKVMEQILASQEIIRESKEQKRAIARLVDYGFILKNMTIRVPLFEKWLKERRDLISL